MGIYAPEPSTPTSGFVNLEPATAITNGMNLAHRGVYKDLQTIPPGQTWEESFWIRPSGF
jgi:aldose 1-epimerase